MPNPFLSPELLNPSIQADVTAAYEKNVAAGRVIDEGFAADLATGGLADKVRETTEQAKQTGSEHVSSLEELSPEARRDLEVAFNNSVDVFKHIELAPPSLEEFREAGVDFTHLASEFERMEQEGLEPTFVLAPSLPLNGQRNGSSNWEEVYKALTSDATIPDNPLKSSSDGDGLYINSYIKQNGDIIYRQEEAALKRDSIHSIGEQAWTIALLPTTSKPQELSTPHTDKETDALSSKHATISQYLTLQATRIQAGETPVDADTYTWLAGTFENGAQAPDGNWSSGGGRVYVNWDNNIGGQYDVIGVRWPVWG